MTLVQPLALETHLVSELAGTTQIFIFIAAIFIAGLGAKFRMPNGVALSMFVLFIVMMAGTVLAGALSGLYVLVLILTSFITYYGLSRYFK